MLTKEGYVRSLVRCERSSNCSLNTDSGSIALFLCSPSVFCPGEQGGLADAGGSHRASLCKDGGLRDEEGLGGEASAAE